MITAQDFKIRSRNLDRVAELANALVGSVPVRSCDPFSIWQKHIVVSQYLDCLSDREIAAAIDAANAQK